jgi:hypothetical protein
VKGLLVIAGIISLLLSGWGMMVGLWGGAGNGLMLLFWLIPTLAFPCFLLRLFWKKMPTFIFWMFLAAQAVVMVEFQWRECRAGDCTTTNPFVITLVALVFPSVWGWLLVALSLQISASLAQRRKAKMTV